MLTYCLYCIRKRDDLQCWRYIHWCDWLTDFPISQLFVGLHSSGWFGSFFQELIFLIPKRGHCGWHWWFPPTYLPPFHMVMVSLDLNPFSQLNRSGSRTLHSHGLQPHASMLVVSGSSLGVKKMTMPLMILFWTCMAWMEAKPAFQGEASMNGCYEELCCLHSPLRSLPAILYMA